MRGHKIPRWFTNHSSFGDAPVTFDPTRDPAWLGNEVQEQLYGRHVLPPGTTRMPLRTVVLAEVLGTPPNAPENCAPTALEGKPWTA